MIYVCDAIMGSGKSSAVISYINAHPEKRFVYITPFLPEADRIIQACPDRHFVPPSAEQREHHFSKLEHTKHLLESGENVATTHAAFRGYDAEMLRWVKEGGYTLIMDEAVDVFREVEYSAGDVDAVIRAGYLREADDGYEYTGDEYQGGMLRGILESARTNKLYRVKPPRGRASVYYWSLPMDVILAFDDVYILTYLFEAQDVYYMFKLHDVDYKYIGVHRDDDGYSFSDEPDYVPEYTRSLAEKIHVLDEEKLNAVGEKRTALSHNWFKTKVVERDTLRKNMYNYFRTYARAKGEEIMWSTYKGSVAALRSPGNRKQHIAFNSRATNEYRNRTALAYCVNIFAEPAKVAFFQERGIDYDQDAYALSTMVQWVWRSAIRDGKEISIYIPSRRMRDMLIKWMDGLSEGTDYETK